MDRDLIGFIEYLKVEKNYSSYTIKSYFTDINIFLDYCKNNKIDKYKITYKEIKGYLSNVFDIKYSSTTISRRISALRTFYNFLYKKKLVDKNVFLFISLPKKEKKLPKYMSYEDINLLFEQPDITSPLGERNRLILELLYGTGIRISELCNIKLSDINFDDRSIKIIGKGNKERIVYYGNTCSDILLLYINEGRIVLLNNKHNDYLIVGAYKKDSKISERSVFNVIDKLVKSASLKKHVSPHVFRHTFATHLLNEGCDILIVKELLGHSSLDTTGIYTHVSNERLRNVYLNSHPRAKKDLK